ncbi:GNAT family N-acetyltransferase [Paenibacillus tianjinensis]|uniref:GNAT family N-acetyltransferase n=1 Tax=Paenibacillus tianjinensis TaxID=2810347 RepID=A0ABX7LF53_9BACL|nr:GNAT family N-acetyltransferase [Paenibacillus tianjinensis]QSF46748.1 GNAT family N-acetyltransferase [Paenibacillus tianjinensis]
MTISYTINAPLEASQAAELFISAGLRRPVDDLRRIGRMLEHADILITAWDGDRLVGVARAITDFSLCCYLSDLAVRKEYQHQGIGKELIHVLRGQLGEEVMLLLLSAPTAMDYYPKIGFVKLVNAFEYPRAQ